MDKKRPRAVRYTRGVTRSDVARTVAEVPPSATAHGDGLAIPQARAHGTAWRLPPVSVREKLNGTLRAHRLVFGIIHSRHTAQLMAKRATVIASQRHTQYVRTYAVPV